MRSRAEQHSELLGRPCESRLELPHRTLSCGSLDQPPPDILEPDSATLLERIFIEAIMSAAAVIVISPAQNQAQVHFRIDGSYVHAFTLPHGVYTSIRGRMKVFAGLDVSERQRPQRASWSVSFSTEEEWTDTSRHDLRATLANIAIEVACFPVPSHDPKLKQECLLARICLPDEAASPPWLEDPDLMDFLALHNSL